MALGRLIHYAFDAALISTVIAGVKRSSGLSPNSSAIQNPTVRSATESFLGMGEKIFDMIQATAISSSYFKKDSNRT